MKKTDGLGLCLFSAWIAFCCLCASPASGDDKMNIALLRAEVPPGFSPDERMALVSEFLRALQETGEFQIVSRDNMDEIIKELKFQASDFVDEEEVVSLGGMLGVDHFVVYSVRSVHGVYHVTAKLISVEKGEVEKIVVQRCENKYDHLNALCGEIAYDLAGIEERKARLRVVTDPPKAEILLLGVRRGASPLTLNLAPGMYLVKVKKSGYEERRKILYVAPGKENVWEVKLKKKRFGLEDYIRGKSSWSTSE